MNINPDDNSFTIKGNKIEKFLALAGMVAQTAVITREHYSANPSAINYIAGFGMAYVGVILGRHLNPEKSMKKAAFLTLGAGALLAAGAITDFSGTNLKDTLLGITAVLAVAGFHPVVEKKEYPKKPKI